MKYHVSILSGEDHTNSALGPAKKRPSTYLGVRGKYKLKWTFKVLMAQFKYMPTILKFITAHALACIFLLIGALVPGIPFYYNGEELSFKEIWLSGIGFFTIYVAIAMPYSGLLILKRADNARLIYLSILSSVLIVPYVYWQDLQGLIFGLVVTSLITAYIFAYPPAKNYFTSNK